MGALNPIDDPLKYMKLVLDEELRGELDIVRISEVAYLVYLDESSGEHDEIMLSLMSMQVAPEFELSRNDLSKIK